MEVCRQRLVTAPSSGSDTPSWCRRVADMADKTPQETNLGVGVGVALGIAFGTVLLALTSSPVWIGVGVAIGAALGLVYGRTSDNESDDNNE